MDELGERFLVTARDYEGKLIASKSNVWALNSSEAADTLLNELEPWQKNSLDVINVYQLTTNNGEKLNIAVRYG